MDLFLRLPRRQLEKVIGLLMVLGYVEINVFTIRSGFFAFVVRGPLFTRLATGAPKKSSVPERSPEGNLLNKTYFKMEALVAYLLLTGLAYIQNPTVVGNGVVFTIQSDLFTLQSIHRMLNQKTKNGTDRVVLMLLNLGIGWGLLQNNFGITGTAFGAFPYQLAFSTTSTLVRRQIQSGTEVGLAAIPNGGPMYRWFNRLVGLMLVLQQLYIYSVSVGRGGGLVFGITGNILELRTIEKLVKKQAE